MMKILIPIFLLLVLASVAYGADECIMFADRINYQDERDIIVNVTWIPYYNYYDTLGTGFYRGDNATINITIPDGWDVTSTAPAPGGECINADLSAGRVVSCNNTEPNKKVGIVLRSNASHSEYQAGILQAIAENGTGGAVYTCPNITFVKINNNEVFHTLVEFGRGRGNYFFDSYSLGTAGSGHTGTGCRYLPNGTLFELNFLHKTQNINQYIGLPTKEGANVTYVCTYPNKTIVREHAITDMVRDALWTVNYSLSNLGTSWERMGFIGMDIDATEYTVPGKALNITCTDIKYTMPSSDGNYDRNGYVRVDSDSFILRIRRREPFITAATAVGSSTVGNGTQEVQIAYSIYNYEFYSVDNIIAEIEAPPYAKFIGTRGELWGTSLDKYIFERNSMAPGELETVTLVARFDTSAMNDTSSLYLTDGISIKYLTCWEANAYSPQSYIQDIAASGVGTGIQILNSSQMDGTGGGPGEEGNGTGGTGFGNATFAGLGNASITVNMNISTEVVSIQDIITDINNTVNNLGGDTDTILNEISQLQEFDEELVFLVTDAFNVRAEAARDTAAGNFDSASEKLKRSNDELQQAMDRLSAMQGRIEGPAAVAGSGGNIWLIPILLVGTIIIVTLFVLSRRPED